MRRVATLPLLSVLLVACAGTVPAEELSVVELARGNNSQQGQQHFELVQGQPRLLEMWRRLDGQAPPAIDFDRRTVIVAFMGERRMGGHSIRIEKVVKEGDRLVVEILMRSPGAGCSVTQALTQPYHFVVVPGLHGEAEFRPRMVAVSCE